MNIDRESTSSVDIFLGTPMDVHIYVIYFIQRVNNGILRCILPYSTYTHGISICKNIISYNII
jgi:hypothetical protein